MFHTLPAVWPTLELQLAAPCLAALPLPLPLPLPLQRVVLRRRNVLGSLKGLTGRGDMAIPFPICNKSYIGPPQLHHHEWHYRCIW